MADIVLTTLNARYAHAAFGLRYLMANLGPLRERAQVVEFDTTARSVDVVEAILQLSPRIVGIGVYIWNVEPATRIVAELKRVRPDVRVIVGGPEVSYETDQQEICCLADHVIAGEADLALAELCQRLLSGDAPSEHVFQAPLPQLDGPAAIELPYELYSDHDIAHRVIYVEASRGCPYRCEFCLSSLDVPVRNVPLDRFLPAMQGLLDRGARHLKFVDRTFNLNLGLSRAILEFLLARYVHGMMLHFEMIPDRLPEALREPIARFPAGALQFEVGIQSFNEEVCQRISRRQDSARAEANLRWLREQTGVHIHADLIVGLPGEDMASFAAGFDRLVALGPQEIQVGLLKRLRGTPISRHDRDWAMVYSPHPPYELLQNSVLDFEAVQRMRRFARYWDLIANSGNFRAGAPLLWSGQRSAFDSFLRLADWLFEREGRTHAIALVRLSELLFTYLTEVDGQESGLVARAIWSDQVRVGRSECPSFLRPHVDPADRRPPRPRSGMLPRQARHQA
jgi:radical SAM superfamily enzyme YgiQ (UPF0313 family)